eukprot:CAMPEP_0183296618 /NCGR_PEP_ID=MMETSP0160_2-20130417/4092_1 /TAXON_ID=2839 ORGANISM="Odontella Sinensis, Strain Grunow 1884" /NCGR_SAMPLE_ID=MMETSP0160_2 /ASSEMBLY_ACC=CAM_ASM_000250 /LENGTH=429 /DNA_ID=CAMNT_0025458249 /DNA_START=32 /DNA_END=1321 /DNA_ORIENTATION=+
MRLGHTHASKISVRHRRLSVKDISAGTHIDQWKRTASSSAPGTSAVDVSLISSPSTRKSLSFPIGSVSFSGAGFLGSYHTGVASCLVKHGILPGTDWLPPPLGTDDAGRRAAPILTGVSAGSIVCAALSAGVDIENDGMPVVLEAARKTRALAWRSLDVLTPGFSLVDQIETPMLQLMRRALGGSGDGDDDYDVELLQRRTGGGRWIRLGLTDRRKLKLTDLHIGGDYAYFYVDKFRGVEDILAACILSSYIPGLTGTASGSNDPKNGAVRRAWDRMKDMERLGFVKDGLTGKPVVMGQDGDEKDGAREEENSYYIDGGLADLCPTIDDETVLVTPLNGFYKPNPSISPKLPGFDESKADKKPLSIPMHKCIDMAINAQNADALRRMIRSSEDEVLEQWFRHGFDDALRFLKKGDLLNVHTITTSAIAS